jgi:hypothetical protein
MSCDIYRDLEGKVRAAKSRWAQFTYKENKHLWGTSAAQASRIAAEAQRQVGELSQKMSMHQQSCPYCISEKKS